MYNNKQRKEKREKNLFIFFFPCSDEAQKHNQIIILNFFSPFLQLYSCWNPCHSKWKGASSTRPSKGWKAEHKAARTLGIIMGKWMDNFLTLRNGLRCSTFNSIDFTVAGASPFSYLNPISHHSHSHSLEYSRNCYRKLKLMKGSLKGFALG